MAYDHRDVSVGGEFSGHGGRFLGVRLIVAYAKAQRKPLSGDEEAPLGINFFCKEFDSKDRRFCEEKKPHPWGFEVVWFREIDPIPGRMWIFS